jgi:hypothetical protein
MSQNTLDQFIARTRAVWGPLSSDLVRQCRSHLEALLKASPDEPWLAALRAEKPASRELYRDPDHGFVLMAHTEPAGLYRRPHDHGRSWVIYGVQSGAVTMGSYARIAGVDGLTGLVQRDATRVGPGAAMTYLPGDIHDTRSLEEPALLFRFTERDLAREDRQAGRITRFIEQDGVWTPETR